MAVADVAAAAGPSVAALERNSQLALVVAADSNNLLEGSCWKMVMFRTVDDNIPVVAFVGYTQPAQKKYKQYSIVIYNMCVCIN